MFDASHDLTAADVEALLEAARWVPSACIVMVNLCQRYVEGSDLEYSELSVYELGQAVAPAEVAAQKPTASEDAGRQRRSRTDISWHPAVEPDS